MVNAYLQDGLADGLLLTGGQDIDQTEGRGVERKLVEEILITAFLKAQLPIVGVCRGMQHLASYFDCDLRPIKNHVATVHELRFANGEVRVVNSYHGLGVFNLKPPLVVEAQSSEGGIEAFRAKNKNIYGMMWHPERCSPFDPQDISFFKKFYQGDNN